MTRLVSRSRINSTSSFSLKTHFEPLGSELDSTTILNVVSGLALAGTLYTSSRD
jgi:hypothetical protein